MFEVLAVVAQQNSLHPLVRSLLSCVSKDIKNIIDTTPCDIKSIMWSDVEKPYISRTDAKKMKLTDDDLEVLPNITKYVFSYKKYGTFYNKIDVYALRHILPKDPPKQNKAKTKRIEQLTSRGIANHPLAFGFIHNGRGGINNVAKRIRMYDECTIPNKNEIFLRDDYEDILERRQRLVEKLRASNLVLRGDSRLCRAYIFAGVGDPDEIAREMKFMSILHTKTNYALLLEKYAKQTIREYGFRQYGEASRLAKHDVMVEYEHLFTDPDMAKIRQKILNS